MLVTRLWSNTENLYLNNISNDSRREVLYRGFSFVFKKGVMNYVQNVQMQRGTRTMQIFRNLVSKGSEEDVNQRNVTNINQERGRNETRIHKIKRPNCALLRKWLAVKRYC